MKVRPLCGNSPEDRLSFLRSQTQRFRKLLELSSVLKVKGNFNDTLAHLGRKGHSLVGEEQIGCTSFLRIGGETWHLGRWHGGRGLGVRW